MKIYCDGSRVGLNGEGKIEGAVIGWSGVAENGALIAKGARQGGSNVNAEMLAIRDTLTNFIAYRRAWVNQMLQEEDVELVVVTDSKTSIQITEGYLKAPQTYDLNESENYRIADQISKKVKQLSDLGLTVKFKHMRGHGRGEVPAEPLDLLGNAFADYVADQASNELYVKVLESRSERSQPPF